MVLNEHLQSIISSITATASVASTESHFPQSRLELDSHVNMVVLGKIALSLMEFMARLVQSNLSIHLSELLRKYPLLMPL